MAKEKTVPQLDPFLIIQQHRSKDPSARFYKLLQELLLQTLAWILHLRVLHDDFINILLYVPFFPTASPILALNMFNIEFKLVITTRCVCV